MLFAFNAEALLKQSASKALSFKNVANDNRGKEKPAASVRSSRDLEKALEHHTEPPMTETVDLTSADTKSISLKAHDTLIINLNEPEADYSWKISPSTSKLSLISNTVVGGVQIVTYKLNNSVSAYIYFDYVNQIENKIEKTKMLTIKLR